MNTNLKAILEKSHKGKSNAIKSFQLERLTNLTGSQIKERVNELRCNGVPVCSGRSGYYIAASREELNHTIAQLNQAYDPDQLGWKTTATDKLIEYAWLKNTDVASNMSPHIKPVTVQKVEGVAASDGVQFAEVVANKVSSLFQVLPVKAGEDYSWKVHHR